MTEKMTRIEVTRRLEHPPDEVWTLLADLAGHVRWMRDARSISFVGATRSGVGARMEVETRIGPLRTNDILEVTGWEEGRAIDVAHRGLVSGEGRLAVEEDDGGSVVSWVEELWFPWWSGGGLTAWLARPLLRSVWSSNLRRLDELLSSP